MRRLGSWGRSDCEPATDRGKAVNFCVERLRRRVGSKIIIKDAIEKRLGLISVSWREEEKSLGICVELPFFILCNQSRSGFDLG